MLGVGPGWAGVGACPDMPTLGGWMSMVTPLCQAVPSSFRVIRVRQGAQ